MKEYIVKYDSLRSPYKQFTITIKSSKELTQQEICNCTDAIANAVKVPANITVEYI